MQSGTLMCTIRRSVAAAVVEGAWGTRCDHFTLKGWRSCADWIDKTSLLHLLIDFRVNGRAIDIA
jgi:hypothetical protein